MLAVFGLGGAEILLLLLLVVPVVLAIVFLHIIGALIYFFVGHPKRNSPRPVGA